MAESEDGQEKKHAPGEKKWEEAAERGQTPRSADVNGAAVLLVGGLVLAHGNALVLLAFRESLVGGYGRLGADRLDLQGAQELLGSALGAAALALAAPLCAVLVAAVLANLAQTGMRMAPRALEPNFQRLNPIQNAQQHYLSWTPLVELGKGLAKVLLVSGGAALAVRGAIPSLAGLSLAPVEELPEALGFLVVRLLLGAIPVAVVIAAGDYAYTTWRMTQQLMRTDRELKDDQKETDGDPQARARRKQLARQLLFSGSIRAVAEADVVITNPTHYAVALRYRRGRDVAPVVVAKGVDAGAKRIRDAARDARVPLMENRALARSLWKVAKVDRPIPEPFYGPVARVLAVVWARKRRPRR